MFMSKEKQLHESSISIDDIESQLVLYQRVVDMAFRIKTITTLKQRKVTRLINQAKEKLNSVEILYSVQLLIKTLKEIKLIEDEIIGILNKKDFHDKTYRKKAVLTKDEKMVLTLTNRNNFLESMNRNMNFTEQYNTKSI